MLQSLFPRQFDNNYRGHVLAIWLLIPLSLVKLLQGGSVAGLNPAKTSQSILETADGVPVGTFPAEAASHLVFLFSAWGLNVFLLSILALIALVRYRAMIPLVYFLFLIEQIGRKWLSVEHLDRPFLSADLTPANLINWGFLATMVVGLALSLARRDSRK